MLCKNNPLSLLMCCAGMLASGTLYALSILKVPFSAVFVWPQTVLSLNYTVSICMLCVGNIMAGFLSRHISQRILLALSGTAGVAGLVLAGYTFGAFATISSAFIADEFGTENFPVNYSFSNAKILVSSLCASLFTMILERTGGYTLPFLFLTINAAVAILLNGMIWRKHFGTNQHVEKMDG